MTVEAVVEVVKEIVPEKVEAAVVEDAKAEAPGEVVKEVMPERVEAAVKAVEEVLAELVKVDTAVVEVVKEVVTEKLEAAVEVVEEVLPEEVEAAVVEVVKEEVKANRRLLLMWPRTLFPRLLLRCPRRLKLSLSMWSRTLSLRLMWPRQSTTTSSALELSRRRARRGRRATGGSGLRQESA